MEAEKARKLSISIKLLKDPVKLGNKQTIFVTVSDNKGVSTSATVNGKISSGRFSSDLFSYATNSEGKVSHSWKCDSKCGTFSVSIEATAGGFWFRVWI